MPLALPVISQVKRNSVEHWQSQWHTPSRRPCVDSPLLTFCTEAVNLAFRTFRSNDQASFSNGWRGRYRAAEFFFPALLAVVQADFINVTVV